MASNVAGSMAPAQSFFGSRPALEKGTTISMLWTPNNTLEVLVREEDSDIDYSKARPAGPPACLPAVLSRSCATHQASIAKWIKGQLADKLVRKGHLGRALVLIHQPSLARARRLLPLRLGEGCG